MRLLKRAFTLVELLVVIGIIALLIAILLPALNGARQQAQSVQCLANLRSCGQLLYIYAQQNQGMFPMMDLQVAERFPRNANNVSSTDSGYTFKYPDVKAALARLANPGQDPYSTTIPFNAGNLKIFYCPSNFFWDADPQNGLSHFPDDFMKDSGGVNPATGTVDSVTGEIGYWYFGDPNPWYPQHHYTGPFGGTLPGSPPASAPSNGQVDWRFWDTNHNGDNRDEFVCHLGEKYMDRKTLMTDQSRINGSGNQGSIVGFQFVHGNHKNFLNGWSNVLYADGHCDSHKPKQSSFSGDHTQFINPNPGVDEVQPRFGNSGHYSMW